MKRNFIKCILFISSYFPLYVFLLILNFENYNSKEELKNRNIQIFLILMGITIVLSVGSLIFLMLSSSGTKKVKLKDIERPDDTIISYIMTYIIPILTVNNMNKAEVLVNIFLFLLIGYLYIRLNLL